VVDAESTRAAVRLINMTGERVTIKGDDVVGTGESAIVAEYGSCHGKDNGVSLIDYSEREGVGSRTIPGADRVASLGAHDDDAGVGSHAAANPTTQDARHFHEHVTEPTPDNGQYKTVDDLLHVQPLIDNLPPDLTAEERVKATALIHEYSHLFSKSDRDMGRTDLLTHVINTGDAKPIRETLRRHPLSQLPIIDAFVDDLLDRGIIEPCRSPWASNVVLVRRKSSTSSTTSDLASWRFCLDQRGVNSVVIPDAYHPPRIDTCLECFGGAKFFTTLDSLNAYNAIPLADEESKNRTAFITRKGQYRYKVMNFGERNACASYSRLNDLILMGLQFDIALAYLDDLIIWADSFDVACDRMRIVFDRIERAGIKFKVSKSKLLQRSITFLSYRVSEKGIEPDPSRIEVITSWPTPTNLTEVRAFVGMCSYYRKFLANFAGIARPMYDLTKKRVPFQWGEAQANAFNELKRCLTTAPILASPLSDGEYKLETDASCKNLGAILYQKQDGLWRVISYASRVLSAAESSYCSSRAELLGVVFGLKQFRHFLLGRKFTLVVDNSSLRYLMTSKMLLNMEARYLALFSEFDFDVLHVTGVTHSAADAISRRPCNRDDVMTMCDTCKPRVSAIRVERARERRRSSAPDRPGEGSETDATTNGTANPPLAGDVGSSNQSVSPVSPTPLAGEACATDDDFTLYDDALRTEQQKDNIFNFYSSKLTARNTN
jgi:RNase H-like domain found in reverse transcriptase/Reverse transcriptase (RNA-dependent DNA polymerase)